MSLDKMQVLVELDIEGYKRQLREAERASERFAGKVAQGLGFGELTKFGIAAGAAMKALHATLGSVGARIREVQLDPEKMGLGRFAREQVQLAQETKANWDTVVNTIGDAIATITSMLGRFGQTIGKFVGDFFGPLFGIDRSSQEFGGARSRRDRNQVRLEGTVRDRLIAAQKEASFALEAVGLTKGQIEARKILDDLRQLPISGKFFNQSLERVDDIQRQIDQVETLKTQTQIRKSEESELDSIIASENDKLDLMNMTEDQLIQKKLQQLLIADSGNAKAQEALRLVDLRIAAQERLNRSIAVGDFPFGVPGLILTPEALEGSRLNDQINQMLRDFIGPAIPRIPEHDLFGDITRLSQPESPEDAVLRHQADLFDLERAREGLENANRLPGLAVRGSQEEARMVNAARNQNNPQHRETINRLDEQIRELRTLIRLIQVGLGAPFDVQR